MKILGLLLFSASALTAEPAWKLTLEENFNGTALNPKIWNVETGKRRDSMNSASAVDLRDGKLVITTYTDTNGVTYCGFVTIWRTRVPTSSPSVWLNRFRWRPVPVWP